MGCPPDPEEVSLGRGNDNSRALKEKAELLIPQLKKASAFLLELSLRYTALVSTETQAEAKKFHQESQHYTAKDLGKTFGWDDFPVRDSTYGYADMSSLYGHLTDSELYVKKIEISLCIVRDLILKTVALIGEKILSEQEQNSFSEEKELHLLHRLEDKAIKLKTLQSDIETCKFVISTTQYDYTQADRDERAEQLKKLEPEYQRILAITDEELLQNRDLF